MKLSSLKLLSIPRPKFWAAFGQTLGGNPEQVFDRQMFPAVKERGKQKEYIMKDGELKSHCNIGERLEIKINLECNVEQYI